MSRNRSTADRNSTFVAVLVIIILALTFVGCGPRRLTPEEEAAATQASIRWLDEQYGVLDPHESGIVLRNVTQRLEQASVIANVPRNNSCKAWKIVIIRAPEPNAFSLGNGTIVVTRGLITQLTSEAAFAAVIAHEMAHQYLGHTADALARARRDAERASRTGKNGAPQYSYSLEQELAADTLAVELLTDARYDPRHTQSALALAYRPGERIVSGDGWLREREVNLKRIVEGVGYFYPATQTTREFERLRLVAAKG